MTLDMAPPTRAEVCVVACAEVWRGDGEILASPIGTVPMIAVRLAVSTFEPDLVYTDGDLGRDSLAVGEHGRADNRGVAGIDQRLSAYDHTNPVPSWVTFRVVGTIDVSSLHCRG